jgi:hypothetical protein
MSDMKDFELKGVCEVKRSGSMTFCEIVTQSDTEVIKIPFKFRSIYDEQFSKLFNRIMPVKAGK